MQAIEQNNISRVYLGVHWKFDATEGAKLGKDIAAAAARCFPERA